MRKLVRKYIELTYEQRVVFHTILALIGSALLTGGKLVIGLLTDLNLVIVSSYTFALLVAKFECVLGTRGKDSTTRRNTAVACLLFAASIIYGGFMCRNFFVPYRRKNNGLLYVLLLACISFFELAFALWGIYRTQGRGQHYRNIKVINFCMALIALLTAQIAILDYTSAENHSIYNGCAGLGVGIVIALCAVYILLAPKLSLVGREHNVFRLAEGEKNLLGPEGEVLQLLLCKSAVYGSYIYRARFYGGVADGYIVREPPLWKRMPLWGKIICCILSEILIPVWLIGRGIYSIRSSALPQRLAKKMARSGFSPVCMAKADKDAA